MATAAITLALVARLGVSDDPADVARLRAQALLLAAYEAERWPSEPASVAEVAGTSWTSMGSSRPTP